MIKFHAFLILTATQYVVVWEVGVKPVISLQHIQTLGDLVISAITAKYQGTEFLT
jgi:hypothetical protein